MSSYLKWSDITIIIIAVIGNITGQFLTAFSKSMTMLWVAYVLWMLWNCITTISRYAQCIESDALGLWVDFEDKCRRQH